MRHRHRCGGRGQEGALSLAQKMVNIGLDDPKHVEALLARVGGHQHGTRQNFIADPRFKESEASVSICHQSMCAPTSIDAAMGVVDGCYMIQVKGWGGGMTEADWGIVGVQPPLGKTQLSSDEQKEAFALHISEGVSTYIADFVAKHGDHGADVPIVLQWDGDKVEFSRMTYGAYGIVRAINTLNRQGRCGPLKAMVVTKLTTPEKAPLFAMKYIQEGGGEVAEYAHADLVIVAYPMESAIAEQQRASNYGFFGANMNRLFPNDKLIIAFGGGGTLDAEEIEGYAANTKIEALRMTRKNGTERSVFADSHSR